MEQEYVNSGSLFATKVKKNPKAPDYWGDILLDLKELGIGNGKHKMRLSGWKITSSKTGTTFLSIKIQPPLEENGAPVKRQQPEADDDVPF